MKGKEYFKEVLIKVLKLKPIIIEEYSEFQEFQEIYILQDKKDIYTEKEKDGIGYVLNIYTDAPEVKKALIKNIKKAKKKIRIAMYHFDDRDICEALNEKIDLDIDIVVDKDSEKTLNKLLDVCGFSVAKKNKGDYFHTKYCVIDDKIVFLGSYNYARASKNNYEVCALMEGKEIVEKLDAYFYSISRVK